MRRRGVVLCALLVAVAAAPGADARVVLDDYKERVVPLPEEGGNVTLDVRFHVERDGQFFAKMLVTPWNPVNDGGAGGPNGSADPPEAWFTTMQVLHNGTSLVGPTARVDSTPTSPVAVQTGQDYVLRLAVHTPLDVACGPSEAEVPFALVFREGALEQTDTSGGYLEQSRGFTAKLDLSGLVCLLAPGTDERPSEGSGTGGTGGPIVVEDGSSGAGGAVGGADATAGGWPWSGETTWSAVAWILVALFLLTFAAIAAALLVATIALWRLVAAAGRKGEEVERPTGPLVIIHAHGLEVKAEQTEADEMPLVVLRATPMDDEEQTEDAAEAPAAPEPRSSRANGEAASGPRKD